VLLLLAQTNFENFEKLFQLILIDIWQRYIAPHSAPPSLVLEPGFFPVKKRPRALRHFLFDDSDLLSGWAIRAMRAGLDHAAPFRTFSAHAIAEGCAPGPACLGSSFQSHCLYCHMAKPFSAAWAMHSRLPVSPAMLAFW
jgi:hypothetical protein